MSICIEGTVAIPLKHEKKFLAEAGKDFRIKEAPRFILCKDDYAIYTLEMGGHSEAVCEWVTLNGGIYEINYLDGQPPYTVTADGDSDIPLAKILDFTSKERTLVKYSLSV